MMAPHYFLVIRGKIPVWRSHFSERGCHQSDWIAIGNFASEKFLVLNTFKVAEYPTTLSSVVTPCYLILSILVTCSLQLVERVTIFRNKTASDNVTA